ncbi:hypothetical protein DRP77_02560 [Candidatus Poribacteria bacterium]|nr:MAG: hypothetical protein DRP77_02560 [Candidatus Poribacteria bacterium]
MAAIGDLPFDLWAVDSLTRVFEETSPEEGVGLISIKCAQNEYESAQLVITAKRDLRRVRVRIGELRGPDGGVIPPESIRANFVGFIPLSRNTPNTPDYELERKAPCRVPDPLLDLEEIDLEKGKSQPVWITVHVPKGTPPGTYEGRVEVICEEGRGELPVEVEVLPFELPDERHLLVTNWFSVGNIAKAHGVKLWSDEFFEILSKYARLMAEHRQSVFLVPWSLVRVYKEGDELSFDFSLFDRFVETFMEAGVEGRIEISHVAHPKSGWGTEVVLSNVTAIDRETGEKVSLPPEKGLGPLLSALQRHLEERGWLDKAMIHISDEPSVSNIDSWKRASEFVARYAPKLRRIDAIEGTDFEGYLEVWVPKLNYFTTWRELFERARERGAELWFYTCCHPFGFFPNRFLDYPLVKTRVLHWINYAYDLKGFLHWGLNFWRDDPFGEPAPNLPPGDTHIVYPGREGPLSSIRFDVMRDGIEDYEYLVLLESRTREIIERLGVTGEFDPSRRSRELCRRVVRGFADCGSALDLIEARDGIIEEIISIYQRPYAVVETYPMEGSELIPGPIVIEVRGAVEEGAAVKVNGREVAVRNGRFVATASGEEVTVEIEKDGMRKVIKRRFFVRR